MTTRWICLLILLVIQCNTGNSYESDTPELDIDLEFNVNVPAAIVDVANGAKATLLCFLKGAVGERSHRISIAVKIDNIDGPNNRLAKGEPDIMTASGKLPLTGHVQIDRADLQFISNRILLHEYMHVLGFGSLWEAHGCVPGRSACTSAVCALSCSSAVWDADRCPAAQAEYRKLGGNGSIPLAQSACGHWDLATFGHEVGTEEQDPSKQGSISRMTVQSFADIGYKTSLDCTEIDQTFQLPMFMEAERPTNSYALLSGRCFASVFLSSVMLIMWAHM